MARTKAFDEKEVLQKAIDLFWEKGYHGTSMDDLVRHMGINRASLYNTFSNKRVLYEKALAHYRKVNNAQVLDYLKNSPATLDSLRDFFQSGLEASLEQQDTRGCFVINSTTELANLDADIQKVVKDNNHTLVTAFQQFLRRMQEQQELAADKDVEGLAHLLLISYSGLRINTMMGISPQANQAAIEALMSNFSKA